MYYYIMFRIVIANQMLRNERKENLEKTQLNCANNRLRVAGRTVHRWKKSYSFWFIFEIMFLLILIPLNWWARIWSLCNGRYRSKFNFQTFPKTDKAKQSSTGKHPRNAVLRTSRIQLQIPNTYNEKLK